MFKTMYKLDDLISPTVFMFNFIKITLSLHPNDVIYY